MKVIVKDFLNVRVGAPSVNAPCYQYLAPGSEIEVDGVLYTGDFFDDSNKWMKDAGGNFYWAGGLKQVVAEEPQVKPIFFNYNAAFKNISQAIRDSKGKDISIAILDSGVYEQHPDLAVAFDKQINASLDFTNSPNTTADKNGHGTHVAGLIGARSDDNIGIVGIAPACVMRNIKVINDAGNSSPVALLMGLKEAKRIPVDIINLSISITFNQFKGMQNAFQDFAMNTIIVAAAGNDDTLLKDDILFPAMSPHVISVGAISKDWQSRNPNAKFNKRVDYILPEISFTSCSLKEKSFYADDAGSSMSAALLSGLIALIMKATNNKSAANIKQELDRIAIKYDSLIDLNSITLIKPV
jgi:subtilisin family serine protease